MHLITLGTGTVAPSPARTAAAHLISDGTTSLLLDCGPGTTHRLAQHVPTWPALNHVGISHFHADHIAELPALISAMQYGTLPARSRPLHLWGPRGLRVLLENLANAFGTWVLSPQDFPVEIHEMRHREPTAIGSLVCEVFPTPHTDESVAWSVMSDGVRMVYTGDTGPSESLAAWADGCDLLLAECSLPESMALDFHLTPQGAGQLAHQAAAGRLVLTHLYPPVEHPDPAGLAAGYYGGEILTARDGDRFDIQAG